MAALGPRRCGWRGSGPGSDRGERPCLDLVELLLGNRSRVEKGLRRGDLIGRARSGGAAGDGLDVLILPLLELLVRLDRAVGHPPTSNKQVREHSDERQREDEHHPQRLREAAEVLAAEEISEDPPQGHEPCEEDEELEHGE